MTEREREKTQKLNFIWIILFCFFPSANGCWLRHFVRFMRAKWKLQCNCRIIHKKRRTTHTLQKPELRTQIDVDMNLCYYLYLVTFFQLLD